MIHSQTEQIQNLVLICEKVLGLHAISERPIRECSDINLPVMQAKEYLIYLWQGKVYAATGLCRLRYFSMSVGEQVPAFADWLNAKGYQVEMLTTVRTSDAPPNTMLWGVHIVHKENCVASDQCFDKELHKAFWKAVVSLAEDIQGLGELGE